MNPENTEHWDFYISKFEEWMKSAELKPIRMGCEIVQDPYKMFNGHLELIKFNKGNPTFHPYIQRLLRYKKQLENTHGNLP